MNILISGGAKNGKSYYAQHLARQMALQEIHPDPAAKAGRDGLAHPEQDRLLTRPLVRPLYYVATMIPRDEEDRARIRRHLREREGWGFETLERGTDLMGLLGTGPAGADNGSSPAGDVSGGLPGPNPAGVFLLDSVTALLSNEMFAPDGTMDPQAPARVAKDCAAFAKATGNTVFVSDYIYGDAERYDTMTEDYRRGLALVDRTLARVCDRVIEVSAGLIEDWKSPLGDGNKR